MRNIGLKLAATGTASVLAATSLAINPKPASAQDADFWGSVLGGFLGSSLSGSSNRSESRNYSSKEIRKNANKMLMNNGLTPIDECSASAVSVIVGSEEVCAMPNHALGIGPGTYRVHPVDLSLIPYGMTARNNINQNPTNIYNPNPGHNNQNHWNPNPVYNNQNPINIYNPNPGNNNQNHWNPNPVYNPPQVINAVNQSSSSFAANGSIHSLNGQQISPPILARLRSLLAGNNIAEAPCGATAQQVTVTVNNQFVICGHPNNKFSPGNYTFNIKGLY